MLTELVVSGLWPSGNLFVFSGIIIFLCSFGFLSFFFRAFLLFWDDFLYRSCVFILVFGSVR